MRIVTDAFAEAGVRLERPYLAPGSVDDYEFRLERPARVPRRFNHRPYGEREREAFLVTAANIGWRLAAEAVWHEDRCNWLGLLPYGYGRGGR